MKKGITLILVMVLAGTLAHAHKVNLFAWVEGDTVHTQSKFSGGTKAQGGKISVYDTNKQLLLQGVTDPNGEFSFKIPGKTALHVVLDATMGHANYWDIPLAEILEALGESPGSAGPAPLGQNGSAVPPENRGIVPETAAVSANSITLAEIEKTVVQALDARLGPLNRMLAEASDPKPGFNDILGGIGYILGLAGVWAYVHYRHQIKALEKK